MNCFLKTLAIFSIFGLSLAVAGPSESYIKAHAIEIGSLFPPSVVQTLSKNKLIFFGEMHGNNEFPEMASRFLKKISENEPIQVGLEYPMNIQGVIDEFLRAGDESLLLKTKFFQDALYHSGRGSHAMVRLLHQLREIPNVKVFCFDVNDPMTENRDTEMAKNILNFLASHSDRKTFFLTGNIHSRLEKGAPWDPNYATMGSEIIRRSQGKYNLDNSHSVYLRPNEGTNWHCLQKEDGVIDCGVHKVGPVKSVYASAVNYESYFLMEPEVREGHQSTLFVRHISASLPFCDKNEK